MVRLRESKVTLGNADAENQEILMELEERCPEIIVNLMRNWKMERDPGKYDKLIKLKINNYK